MLVVKIELHSAVTGKVKEIGRAYIWNRGNNPDPKRGDYGVAVCRRGEYQAAPAIWGGRAARYGEVLNYPRLSYNVWRLVARALKSAFPEEAR